MRALRVVTAVAAALLMVARVRECAAGVTVFFDPSQVAVSSDSGATWDQVTCDGYVFTYTRDKLFTGGGPAPIGRPVRVWWPAGVEAQYVTAGPTPDKATITLRRVDGGVFDFTSFTAKLLANAGAGRAIEIVPMLNGEEPFADPFTFDVSGVYGQQFSYDTSPNPWGSTAPLVGFDTYKVRLTLDYALTALTLTDPSTISVEPGARAVGELRAAPIPAANAVRFALPGVPGAQTLTIHSVDGALVRTLALDGAGGARWDLRDASGRRVVAGVYFARSGSERGPSRSRRLVVIR